MGYATRHTAAHGADHPQLEGSVTHDMRPAFDAIVTVGELHSGRQVTVDGEHALLLVHLHGRPLGVRFGDNIGEEVEIAEGGALAVAAHMPVRVKVFSPVDVLTIAFGEDLMRNAPVPSFGRRRGHNVLQSGRAVQPEAIAGVARLLANDLASVTGRFSFRSALTLAMIEGLAHDDGLVRHREEVASNYTGAGIERALRLIDENLSSQLSLEMLASEAGISPFHLSRSFRRIVGLSIQGHIRERRLKEACRLLAETRKPLAEIAYDCGFSSQSRMTTVFRQILDTTPLAFRNQCWRNEND